MCYKYLFNILDNLFISSAISCILALRSSSPLSLYDFIADSKHSGEYTRLFLFIPIYSSKCQEPFYFTCIDELYYNGHGRQDDKSYFKTNYAPM